jgi:hypothetical protein
MSARHADVLVVGHSLEAAVAALKLRRDGWTVSWVGEPAPVDVTIDGASFPACPTVAPAPAHAPGLAQLTSLSTSSEWRRGWHPTQVQLLGERQRHSVSPERLAHLQPVALASNDAMRETPSLSFLSRWQLERSAQRLLRSIDTSGESGELLAGLEAVLGEAPSGATLSSVRLAADLHRYPGGLFAVVKWLYDRFSQQGGWTLPIRSRLKSLNVGWSDVGVDLPDGTSSGARLMLLGGGLRSLDRLLPEDSPFRRTLEADETPLLRLSIVAGRRGVPLALGDAAVLDGRYLLERHALSGERCGLNLFWRSDGSPVVTQGGAARSRLHAILPFIERHVTGEAPVQEVLLHERVASRRLRLARRVLHAASPQAGLGGLEGGIQLGLALAAQSRRLAPRKELRSGESN